METSSTSQEDLLQVDDVAQKAFSLLEVVQMAAAGAEPNLHRLENEGGKSYRARRCTNTAGRDRRSRATNNDHGARRNRRASQPRRTEALIVCASCHDCVEEAIANGRSRVREAILERNQNPLAQNQDRDRAGNSPESIKKERRRHFVTGNELNFSPAVHTDAFCGQMTDEPKFSSHRPPPTVTLFAQVGHR